MITNILTAVVTAYVATGHTCADCKWPVPGRTIALPRRFPLGSVVVMDGVHYIGHDRTAIRYDGRFDVFMADHHAAVQWGSRLKTITVITP